MSDFVNGTPVLSNGGGRGIFRGYSDYVPEPGARWAEVDWPTGRNSIDASRIVAMPQWLVDLMRWYDNRAGHGTTSLLRTASSALDSATAAQFQRIATELIRQSRQVRGHAPVHGPELISVAMAYLPETEQQPFVRDLIEIEVALSGR